jgi:RsiW-degrading membrane proteinase PrsW (M82 family)
MDNLIQNPKTLVLVITTGIVPSLIWLWFWLQEDREHPEPLWIIFSCFVAGMLATFLALPFEKLAQNIIVDEKWQIISWSSIEEIIKYLMIVLVLNIKRFIKYPLDWPIYLITTALGFAAMENIMFLINPATFENATVSLLTGQLRFLGSTLLHAVSSGIIGIAIGLAMFKKSFIKSLYLLWGILISITLHSAFNFFIIRNDGNDFLKVFAFLWVATIINLLLFEKLRRISGEN